ncbi:MAG: aminotransferase class V-fold PLP-dependent enzyme [Limnochordaceae bacterium]|nr:aminotransferase class V-fold PLP-dependent enzyme [Limnochordaceae bacterium]
MEHTQELDHIQAVRRSLPAVLSQVYLNTGTAAPLPTPVSQAIQSSLRQQLEQGRANPATYRQFERLQAEVRAGLADLIGADPDEIALTHHTTEGLNLVVWGLPWAAGDWVLTTNLEHEGALLPLYQLHRRRTVTIRLADLGLGEPEVALARLTPLLESGDPTGRPPRLLVLSHVSFATGAVLPLAEITAAAHSHGTQILVDGAQSVGALPVDVHQLQVDYYAFPGQKWLCGPEGTGGLYVRRDRWAELEPTMLGWASIAESADLGPLYALDSPYYLPAPGARRYETGTVFPPGIAGLAAALQWRREEVGEEWALRRVQQLVEYARQRLATVPGLRLFTPTSAGAGAGAGLLHFRIESNRLEQSKPWGQAEQPGQSKPEQSGRSEGEEDARGAASRSIRWWVQALLARGFMVRSIRQPASIRISVSFFNTEEELDRLVATLEELGRTRTEQ